MSVNIKLVGPCLALFLLCSISPLHAQSASVPFDQAFTGGEEAYFKLLRKNVMFSKSTIRNKTQGVLIYALTLSRQKEVYIKFLTRLDDDIEKSFMRTLNKTEGMWKEVAGPVTYYHAFYFGIGKSLSDAMEEEESFKTTFQPPWLTPLTLTAKSTVIVTGGEFSDTTPPPLPSAPSSPDVLRQYRRAVSQFNKQMEKGKAKKAYKPLSTAISYNPFNKELIEARIKLSGELGLSDFVETDKALLIALRLN
ncbi:MAG: hypothetical protein Roseis2KO_06320 [Roseivirga sp.]